jgi:ketosteroid isomerase-like protein
VPTPSNAELARRVLKALSHGDVPDFAAVVHPEIEIRTSKTTYLGPEAATEWAQKRYEHLERHYAIDRLEEKGDHVVARVTTQYVWRESGLVGDEEPTVIDLTFRDGKLWRFQYRED